MIRLSDTAIKEYQELWEKHHGRTVDKKTAQREGKRLLSYLGAILKTAVASVADSRLDEVN